MIRVFTVLPFSVFSGFQAFGTFCPGFGSGFGPYLSIRISIIEMTTIWPMTCMGIEFGNTKLVFNTFMLEH